MEEFYLVCESLEDQSCKITSDACEIYKRHGGGYSGRFYNDEMKKLLEESGTEFIIHCEVLIGDAVNKRIVAGFLLDEKMLVVISKDLFLRKDIETLTESLRHSGINSLLLIQFKKWGISLRKENFRIDS
jgi:hypothetical protein